MRFRFHLRQIRAVLALALLLITFLVLIFGLVSMIRSTAGLIINVTYDARLIMQILVYLLLILGVTGIIRGILDFFVVGKNFDPDNHLNDVVYEKIVHRTADYLILFGGALLFLWLL